MGNKKVNSGSRQASDPGHGALTETRLTELCGSSGFIRLRDYRPHFDPMRSLGVQYRELSHSAFLRFMLDPAESHGLESRFLREFTEIIDFPPQAVQRIVDDDTSIKVRTEFEGIDVFVECGLEGPVIGIEVKVWAAEQPDQIARYQEPSCLLADYWWHP